MNCSSNNSQKSDGSLIDLNFNEEMNEIQETITELTTKLNVLSLLVIASDIRMEKLEDVAKTAKEHIRWCGSNEDGGNRSFDDMVKTIKALDEK